MNIKKTTLHKHLGFTLIEVMVAVAIFAIAGGAIMKSVYEHLRSISTLEQVSYATWVANNQLTLAALESQTKWPLDKEKSGEVEMVDTIWYWKRNAIKTADQSLYEVTVVVASDEEMKNTITSVKTYMTKVE